MEITKKLVCLVELMYTTFWKPKRAVDSSVVFGEEEVRESQRGGGTSADLEGWIS